MSRANASQLTLFEAPHAAPAPPPPDPDFARKHLGFLALPQFEIFAARDL